MKRAAKAQMQDRRSLERDVHRQLARSQDIKPLTQYAHRGFYSRLHDDE